MKRGVVVFVLVLALIVVGSICQAKSDDEMRLYLPPESIVVDIEMPALPYQSYSNEVVSAVESVINETVLEMIAWLLPFGNVVGTYEVDLHQDQVLSVTLYFSAYRAPMAHPAHLASSLTFDLRTGQLLGLADLFAGEAYIDIISEHVAQQIAEREIPLLRPFERIASDQDFRLTPTGLVIYFQRYDLAPYAWGLPEFFVPYEAVLSNADEALIAVLLAGIF